MSAWKATFKDFDNIIKKKKESINSETSHTVVAYRVAMQDYCLRNFLLEPHQVRKLTELAKIMYRYEAR